MHTPNPSKKLDMGKGCVRFKRLDDLALEVVGRTVARVPVKEHMTNYRAARPLMSKGKNGKKFEVKNAKARANPSNNLHR